MKRLGKLRTDIAAAKHDHRARQFGQGQRRRAVERRHVDDPRNSRQAWARARRDDDPFGGEALARDLDAAVNEAGLPFAIDHIVILRQQISVFRLPKTRNQGVFLGNLSGPIDDARAAFNAIEAGFRIIGVTHGFRGPDQGFRGHTTDIDAGAANRAVPDKGHLRALFGGRDRGRESGRASPDDYKIVTAVAFAGTGSITSFAHLTYPCRLSLIEQQSASADGPERRRR